METDLSYSNEHHDADWGSVFREVMGADLKNIYVCHVTISDLKKLAAELSNKVLDHSWVMDLDHGSRPTYQQTVAETAEILVSIIKNQTSTDDKISSEFGEIMVSMGASRALETIFSHISIPLAELWKPKAKGNEGFDFHTVCPSKLINFGEAKFCSSSNPYGGNPGESTGAGGQADGFVEKDKHHRDRPLLTDLGTEQAAIDNLKNQSFGVVLAFSLNAKKPLKILKNAITQALKYQNLKKAQNIYIVGVSHATS
jgi:hypothetical protein